MTTDELRQAVMDALLVASTPLSKDDAMTIVREVLADYPKQLSEFGQWFDKNYATVLQRVNGS